MTSHLEVEVKEKVLEIKINKPKVNAIDLKLSQDLGKAFAELRDNPDLRVGIITGEGDKIFSAGWDLKAVNSGEMALDMWWEKVLIQGSSPAGGNSGHDQKDFFD